MREGKFDDKIRELLNDAHESYDNSSWDRLSERLDSEGDSLVSGDEDFIPIVKEKLEEQRVDVPEEHWTSLKSDLDYIEERKERLYIVKALEAAIILLLVFTYFNYKYHSTDVKMDFAYIEEVQAQSENSELINASISFDEINTPPQVNYLNNRNSTHINTPPKIDDIKHIENNLSNLLTGVFAKSENEFSNQLVISTHSGIIPIEKLGINFLKTDRYIKAIPSDDLNMEMAKADITTEGWSIGMPFSYDVNFINTDINLGYLSHQIESGLGGNSFGISVGYRKGKYEIESGFRYAEKTFVPGLLTNYSKTTDNSFLKDQLDHMVIKQIQIPLLGKIYASPSKRATLYGIAGMAVNAIIHNQYAISRTVQSKSRIAKSPTIDVVDLQDLPRGFGQGGTLKENLYVTGIVGIGLQSYLTNGISWYLQPQYQHSFTSEINQLVNKVNSISIEGGIKFAF